MSRGSAALLLALVLPAAGQAQEGVELSGPDRPIHLRLETLYSVGAVDGASWEAFSTLDGAAFGPDGRLYLLDASVGRVVAVRSGELDHVVGREGDGPGEYRRPRAVVVLAGGRVAVWDAAKRAFRRGGPLRPVEPSGEVNAHPVIPAIQRIVAGGTNKIWVQRPDPENPMLPGPIDILDVDGRYIGTVVEPSLGLPDAFGPDGRVVFLTTGEFDVPVARVYRLPEPLR